MKKLISVAIAAAVSAALCACTTPPTSGEVSAIQQACTLDALARPTVTALLALPGLATPEEVAAVDAARAVIGPVCANPGAPVSANAAQIVAQNVGQVQAVLVELQARKAGAH